MQTVSISAYKFVTLDDHETLRPVLLTECQARELKGTVLLTSEGINIFLADSREAIGDIVGWLRTDTHFADLASKKSLSNHQPSRHLLVRMKKEAITIRHPLIRPEDGRAPSVAPPDLKWWLDQGHGDEGRPMMMLDTRNDYEVAVDTFKNVVEYNLKKFAGFPPIIAAYKDDSAGKMVVPFCAGSIHYEKATVHIQETDIEHVYRLEGDILKCFEEVDGAYYDDGCFVFDHHTALNAELQPAGPEQCFACRAVVTPEERQSAEYIPDQRCPRCIGNQTRAAT